MVWESFTSHMTQIVLAYLSLTNWYTKIGTVLTDSKLKKLIKKNKDGINLKIRENGKNLSGGEMQRIAIAGASAKFDFHLFNCN